MDMMDEAVDLILLYEVERLPSELSSQVDVLQRCAELTADAMPRLLAELERMAAWLGLERVVLGGITDGG